MSRLTALLVLPLFAIACDSGTRAGWQNSSGSAALSRDDALLYAVDSDTDSLAVIDTATEAKVAMVKVGRAPERVTVGPDDSIYVTNRGSRSVSVIRRGTWEEAARIPVGVEPVGLAVSPDNQTLYVVNSTSLDSPEYGTVTAIGTQNLQVKWEARVGEEPRGITLVDGNRAVVTLYKRGTLVSLDLEKGEVTSPGADNEKKLYDTLNAAFIDQGSSGADPSGFRASGFSSFRTRAAADVVPSPDGRRLYAPVMLAREDTLAAAPSAIGGYYSNGGPCNIGAIATAGLITYDSDTQEPEADDLTSCVTGASSDQKDFPPTAIGTPTPSEPVQGTVAVATDETGSWIYLVNKESNNVAVMPTERRVGDDLSFNSTGSTIRSLVRVGAAPTGIALTRDGKKAYVHNSFDHSISTLEARGSGDQAQVVVSRPEIKFAEDVLPRDVVVGRKLFHAADDTRLSAATTGVSCNSCHLEGREDGHVWQFPDGPRQTPSLAGRMTNQTGPYHWNGEFATMAEFLDHTVRMRMGGTGLRGTDSAQMAAYLDTIPAPDSPAKRENPTDAQVRGAQHFQEAKCSTCHEGAAATDNKLHDVGTFVYGGRNPDDLSKSAAGMNTPSLLTVGRTAPYLHDGSAVTLKERLLNDRTGGKHGEASKLSPTEVDDLVAFLQSL